MPHRSVDMKDWEVALNMANSIHNPDRTRLLDLYDSILVDSHLASVMESRVLRVMRSKFKLVDKNGKPQPELLELFEQQWFDDFLRFVAESQFRGHTLIELGEILKPGALKEVNRIDQRNVLPWTGVVVKQRGQTKGYEFREAPLKDYLIEIGRPEELGLLARVAPVAVVKKYAIGSWSEYVEKFGIPSRWVKSNTTDRTRIKQLEEVMQQMVSASYAVIQGDETIEVMATPGSDAHKVFDELISRMNSEISKRILGQDGTSDNKDASGTYGSLKVLQGVAEDRHQSDKSKAIYVINNELIPRLINLGYPLNDIRFQWDELRDMPSGELVEAVAKLGLVYDIDPTYVEERTGIRILGARRMPGEISDTPPADPNAVPPTNPPGNGKQSGKKKPVTEPTAMLEEDEVEDEDEDEDYSNAFVAKKPIGFKRLEAHSAPWPTHLTECELCSTTQFTATADPLNDETINELLRAAHNEEDFSHPYFTEVARRYRDGLFGTWSRDMEQLDYTAVDHAAAAAMEINVFQFSAAKTTAALVDLNHMARDAKGFGDFKKKVDESGILDSYNKRYLEAEYQQAVNVGMQTSRYHQLSRDIEAHPYWEYYTQGDPQVRPTHAALDGKVFEATDPIWDKIYPPNGWNCRCTVLPVAFRPEEVLTEQQGLDVMRNADPKDYNRMKESGQLVNRSKQEVVFDLDKAYRDQLKNKDPRNFKFGVEASYGQKGMDFESIRKGGAPSRAVTLKSNKDALAWFDRNSQVTGEGSTDRVLVATDHMGRKVHISRANFDKHLQGEHRTERHSVADLIPEVLSNPDEVWITGSKRETKGLSYVKFYDEGIMHVRVLFDDGALRVVTWNDKWTDNERNGLLIKRHK